MSFRDDINRFRAGTVARRAKEIHDRTCDYAFQSIVEGSMLTGAPGQPVDTGYLKGSWQNLITGIFRRAIVTNVIYAPIIEEGTRAGRALVLRSRVGGFRSVALTRIGWPNIVAKATADSGGVNV